MNHSDEYQALIGATKDDVDYATAVQRTYYAAEAGRHADRMLGLLLNVRGDLVPRRDIEMLAEEVRAIIAGQRIPSDATVHANPHDCPANVVSIRDARCTTKGASD